MSLPSARETPLGPPPRPARLHPRFRLLRWLIVSAAIVSPSCVLTLGSYDHARLAELERDGRVVAGTIVDKRIRQARSKDYLLEGAFELEGRRYTTTEDVSRERYEATALGAGIEITYLPADPERAVLDRVDAARVAGQRGAIWAAAVALALALGFVVWIYEHYVRRALRLVRRGQASLATIEAGRGVRYRFRDGSGAEHRGRSGFRGAPPPEIQIGAEAVVLYDPHKPRRNALLASLRQLVRT